MNHTLDAMMPTYNPYGHDYYAYELEACDGLSAVKSEWVPPRVDSRRVNKWIRLPTLVAWSRQGLCIELGRLWVSSCCRSLLAAGANPGLATAGQPRLQAVRAEEERKCLVPALAPNPGEDASVRQPIDAPTRTACKVKPVRVGLMD